MTEFVKGDLTFEELKDELKRTKQQVSSIARNNRLLNRTAYC
jgi:hypothetical protein